VGLEVGVGAVPRRGGLALAPLDVVAGTPVDRMLVVGGWVAPRLVVQATAASAAVRTTAATRDLGVMASTPLSGAGGDDPADGGARVDLGLELPQGQEAADHAQQHRDRLGEVLLDGDLDPGPEQPLGGGDAQQVGLADPIVHRCQRPLLRQPYTGP
jgi:hypothetical protein